MLLQISAASTGAAPQDLGWINRGFPQCLSYSRFLGALTQFPGSMFCHDSEKGARSLV